MTRRRLPPPLGLIEGPHAGVQSRRRWGGFGKMLARDVAIAVPVLGPGAIF